MGSVLKAIGIFLDRKVIIYIYKKINREPMKEILSSYYFINSMMVITGATRKYKISIPKVYLFILSSVTSDI